MFHVDKKMVQEFNKGRKFTFMPTLDGYIFREFLIPFSILAITFTLLFLISDLFNDLADFLDHSSEKGVLMMAIQYFIIKMPGNIRFVMPISVLLSCMYTVANLGRCREITAMRASGISLLRFSGSICLSALVVTGVNFWFNEQIVPECDASAQYIIQKVKDPSYEKKLHAMLQYRSPDKQRDWFFMDFNPRGKHHRVILKQYHTEKDGKRSIAWDLQAESAEEIPKKGWVFYNCVITEYHPQIHIPISPKHYDRHFIPSSRIPEDNTNIMNAIKSPDTLSSAEIIRILRSNPNMAPSIKASYMTMIYYRMAFPWCCFLCVFLGLPMAAKNERSGIFLSIVFAVAAIVIYHMLTEIFLVLGRQGFIPPIIGGLGPTIIFMFYSYFFVIRKTL